MCPAALILGPCSGTGCDSALPFTMRSAGRAYRQPELCPADAARVSCRRSTSARRLPHCGAGKIVPIMRSGVNVFLFKFECLLLLIQCQKILNVRQKGGRLRGPAVMPPPGGRGRSRCREAKAVVGAAETWRIVPDQ